MANNIKHIVGASGKSKRQLFKEQLKERPKRPSPKFPPIWKGNRPIKPPRPLPHYPGGEGGSRTRPLPHYPGGNPRGNLPEGFKERYSEAMANVRKRTANRKFDVGQGYAGLGAVEMNMRKAQHTAMANIAKAKHQEASGRLSDMTNLIGAHGSDPAFMMQHGQSVLDSAKDAWKKMESAARDYSLWYNRGKKFRR